MYTRDNPINYRYPSGYQDSKTEADKRRRYLYNYGMWLRHNQKDSLRSFSLLATFAGILAKNVADDFVTDLNCVILGYCAYNVLECSDMAEWAARGSYPIVHVRAPAPGQFLNTYVFPGQGSWADIYSGLWPFLTNGTG